MARSDINRRYLECLEISLGPLRWRSSCVHEDGELASDGENNLPTFTERLQALIRQARRDGLTSRELDTIFRQHTLGEQHGDA